jgi:hypothetical protein
MSGIVRVCAAPPSLPLSLSIRSLARSLRSSLLQQMLQTLKRVTSRPKTLPAKTALGLARTRRISYRFFLFMTAVLRNLIPGSDIHNKMKGQYEYLLFCSIIKELICNLTP